MGFNIRFRLFNHKCRDWFKGKAYIAEVTDKLGIGLCEERHGCDSLHV